MTKKGKPTEVLTRKQISKREREAQQRRILYAIATVTTLAVLAVLGFGFYQEYIVKPSAPIALVNDKSISTRDYQTMVKYRRFELENTASRIQYQLSFLDPTAEEQQFLVQYFQQQLQQIQLQQMNLPMQILDSMIDDELIRQEAARRNITATPEEVQAEIEQQFGYERNPPTPTPTPITATLAITVTPTPTKAPMTLEEFQRNYNEYVISVRKNAGMSETAFRRLFESSIYQRKLQEAFAEEVPTTAEQVHARHILVNTEEEAQKVMERLQAGEDFAALAEELSKDPGSASKGGDLGWFPRGMMVTEFEEAAFALQPGETSDIIKTSYGYHIINVIERDANRPLDEDFLAQKKASALDDWLEQQRNSEAVKRYWSSDKVPPTK